MLDSRLFAATAIELPVPWWAAWGSDVLHEYLIVLWGCVPSAALSAFLADDDGNNVGKVEDNSNNGIGDRTSLGVIRELESETTVDDTERNHDSAKPNMDVRRHCSGLEAFEVIVVHPAEDGLEEEENKE